MEKGLRVVEFVKLRKTAQLEDKLFSFEFKENSRTKDQFFEICDNVPNSYIHLPLTAMPAFLDMLNFCIAIDSQHQQHSYFNRQFIHHDKIISLNIGRNLRGRFLKVSVTSLSNNKHGFIIIPSENKGWETFRSMLMELNDTARAFFPLNQDVMGGPSVETQSQSADQGESSLTPQQNSGSNSEIYQTMEACGKRFLFNIVTKKCGQALKIREVNSSSSPFITVPMWCLQRFCQEIAVFIHVTKHISTDQLRCNEHPQHPHAAAPAMNESGESEFSRVIDADQKRFFLDLTSNTRGPLLKIREITHGSDFYISVPVSNLERFYDTIANFQAV